MYTLDVLCKVNSDNRKVWAAIYNPILSFAEISAWASITYTCLNSKS